MVQMSGPPAAAAAGAPRRPRPVLLALWLAAALALGGCGSAKPIRPDRFYTLEPVALEGPAGRPAPAVLVVNDLAGRGFLGGSQILYRTREEPLIVQRYDDLLWADPPPQALAQALVGAIRAAGVVDFVAVPADRARADYLLGGEVVRFEHLPTDRPPRVAADLQLTLVRGEDRRALATRRYSGEEPLSGNTPDAMAQAFNRLATRLVTQAVRDLRALMSRPGSAAAAAP